MERSLSRTLSEGDDDLAFADLFIKTLRKYFRGEGISAQIQASSKLDGIQRVNFAMSRDYIKRLNQLYQQANSFRAIINPYYLVLRVIRQLEQYPRIRSALDILRRELEQSHKNCPDLNTTMTPAEFWDLMSE